MQRRRRKSHTLRNALIAIIVLIFIISIVVVAYRMGGGTGSPAYSDVSTTTDNAGTACAFSALWSGNTNVSGYIFGTNNTGVFVNASWTPFFDFANQTSAYSRVTETLDSHIGDVVNWGFWCNDTSNRWSEIPLQTVYVVSDRVLIETNMGNMTIGLFDDMPITTGNFKNLVRTGVYDGTSFTRVAAGFVIQGGDATGRGITVANITDELPNKHSNLRGYVAMAKTSQPNSATSQFFINLNDSNAANLDSNYSVFGKVIAGMDVVDAISQVPFTPGLSATDGTPLQPVTMIKVVFIS
ncbi:MAG TPA: peptidylprolyl isomerase [candidate division Zixibacteria bacterium]|nr:peptidylprolyl isomerase [candidate division Zixibacteria bacterium]